MKNLLTNSRTDTKITEYQLRQTKLKKRKFPPLQNQQTIFQLEKKERHRLVNKSRLKRARELREYKAAGYLAEANINSSGV